MNLARLLRLVVTVGSALALPQVKIGHTTLNGREITGLGQDFFGGIPFAEPPVGKRRLERPVLKTFMDVESFDASQFGPGCLQPDVPADMPISEDCLTINVLRPSGLSPNLTLPLPVLFWTYGGGFYAGASSMFNASAIVAQSVLRGTPVIYVNFNYRLGPLGFPQGSEAARRGELNLAIRDQLAALEWVHGNIRAFGGDPSKVTVFGESAGAIMTAVLFLDPSISRFARGGIFESGSAATSMTFGARHRQAAWESFVVGIPGCEGVSQSNSTFDCVRSANESQVLAGIVNSIKLATEQFPFEPTLDGPGGVFPNFPSKIFEHQFTRLPFISGTNLDEGTFLVSPTSTNDSVAAFRQIIIDGYSPPAIPEETLDAFVALYPDDPTVGSPYNTGNETFGLPLGFKMLASAGGDIAFDSQRRSLLQTAAKNGVKAFGYQFSQQTSALPAALGVAHGTELEFVYGQVVNGTEAALQLSEVMIDYWVSFATSLDPNDGLGVARPHWPEYTVENAVLIQLKGGNTTVIPDDYRKEQIDFINAHPVTFHH